MKNIPKKLDNITISENLRNQNKMGKPCVHCNTRDRKLARVPTSEEMELAWVELKEHITSLFRRDLVSTIPPSVVTRMMHLSETLLLGDLCQLLLRFKSLISRLIIENKNTLNRIFTKKITCKALAFCLLEHVIQNFKVMVNSGKALQKCLIKLQNKIHVDIYVLCVNLFRLYYFEDPNIQEKITQSLDSLSSVVKLEVTSTLNDARLEIKSSAQQWPNIEQIVKKLSEKPENTKKKKIVKEVRNPKENIKKNNKPNPERCTSECSQCVQDITKKSEKHTVTLSTSNISNNVSKTYNVPPQSHKSSKNSVIHPQLHMIETAPNKQLENQAASKHVPKKTTNSGVTQTKEKSGNDSRDIDSLVAFINGKNPVSDHTKTQKAKEKKKLKKEKRKLKKLQAITTVNTNINISAPVHEMSHLKINKTLSKSDHCIITKESNITNKCKETNVVTKPIESSKKEKNKHKKSQEKVSLTSTTCTQTVSQNHAELLAKLQRSSQVSISAVSTNCSQPSSKDFRSTVKDITAQISTITVSPRCDAPFPILNNNNNNINKQLHAENSGSTNGSRMVSIKRIDSSARGPTVTMTVKGENSTDKTYYLMRNGQADTKTYNMFRNINNAEKEKSAASHTTALKTISFDNSEITLSNSRNKKTEYCNTDTLKLSKYLNEIEIIPIPNPVNDENLENQQNSDVKPSKKRKKNKKKKNATIENQCTITSCNREQPIQEITKKQVKLKANNNEKQKVEVPAKKNKVSKIINDTHNTKDKSDLDKLKKQNSNIQSKNVNSKNISQPVANQKSSKKQTDTQQKPAMNSSKFNQNISKKEMRTLLSDVSSKITNTVSSNGKKKKSQKKSKEINPEDLQLPGGITVIKLKSGEDGIVSKTKTTLDSVTKIKNNRKNNNSGDQKFRQPVNPFNYSYFSQDQTSTWNNSSGVEFGSQDLLTYFNQKLSFGTMQNNPQLTHSSQSYLQPKVMQTSIGTSHDNISNYETIDSRHAKTAVPPRHDFDSRRHEAYDHGGNYPANYWPMHFGADNVFAPKEGIDPTTLDAEEAEIEQFKRFCNEPVSRARREPTHLNMTGIFKKKQ